jgi:hypothetical protein
LRVQKVFFCTINQFRDGARISDRLVENMIPKHFPVLTSKLLANWLISCMSRLINFWVFSKFQIKKYSPLWFRAGDNYKVSFKRSTTLMVDDYQ